MTSDDRIQTALDRVLELDARRLRAITEGSSWSGFPHESDLYALAAEVRRLRDGIKAWEDKEADRGMCCWQMEQELDAARAKAASYREANESIAVCANHTEDILYSDDCPCVICELHTAHTDLAAASAEAARLREAIQSFLNDDDWAKESDRKVLEAALEARR